MVLILRHFRALAGLASCLAACHPIPAGAQAVSGPATVVDGDTLDLTGMRIRLFGIDAPETKQSCQRGGQLWACGTDAAQFVRRMAGAGAVRCIGTEHDVYGRLVARCEVGGIDLGQSLIAAGLAIALANGAADYGEAEARARRFRLGLWGSTFERPSDWRAAHPREPSGHVAGVQPRETEPVRPRIYRNSWGCAIKGNRNRKGQWIYHLPGTKYYERTRAEEFFCNETDARAAGYRPSQAG